MLIAARPRTGRGSKVSRWRAPTLTLLGFLSILGLLLGEAPPASAHATLLFTTPSANTAVPGSPPVIQLVFDEPVTAEGTPIRLTDGVGRTVRLGVPKSGGRTDAVTVPIADHLQIGQYLVDWQVTAADGDTITGEFRFGVGSRVALDAGVATSTTNGPSLTLASLRWLLFGGFALALGGLVGDGLARMKRPDAPRPPPRARTGLVVSLVATAGLAANLWGGGSMVHGLRHPRPTALWNSTPGLVLAFESGAILICLLLVCTRRDRLAMGVLLVVALGEGVRAHPHEFGGALGILITAVHFTAAGLWVGALVQVVRVAARWRRDGIPTVGLVRAYSWLAMTLFIAVVATGLLAGILIVPADQWWTTLLHTRYGHWLVVKLALVLGAASLAWSGRRDLRSRTDRRQPSRAAGVEAVVLAVVLAASAAITTVAPPVAANQSLPFPPTPSGPSIGLGTRAGFIGLGLTASTGQLVVRLSVPETSDGGGSGGENATPTGNEFDLNLAGNVTPNPATNPALEPPALAFRRCGYGCFVAPITWRPGTVTVTLKATAKGWPGGTAALHMTWPPIGAAAGLSRLVRRMQDVAVIVLHERVTSNTNTGLGRARTLHLSGHRFLKAEPYASGRATSVTLKSPPAGEKVLALAYPSEGIYALLSVGADGRIRQERLTTPTELITRTFVYPRKEGPRLPESGVSP